MTPPAEEKAMAHYQMTSEPGAPLRCSCGDTFTNERDFASHVFPSDDPATDTEIRAPIHAAIPDGEDEIRKRLTERIAWHRRRCYLSKQDCDDAAIVLARLTALEAENAALTSQGKSSGPR
jgi:hypothetical protein